MEALEIEYDRLDYSDSKTRLAILELLSRAQILTGFDGFSGKLFIEVYPDEVGGCVFYFTVLHTGERRKKQAAEISTATFPEPLTFMFDNVDHLTDAATGLYKRGGHRIYRSSLYTMNDRYYLVIVPFHPADPIVQSILSEYAISSGKGSVGIPFLAEHGRLLAADCAIDQLAGH